MLNLILEWNDGDLNWIDPATVEHIPAMQEDREGSLAVEVRTRELEGELRRLRGEWRVANAPSNTPAARMTGDSQNQPGRRANPSPEWPETALSRGFGQHREHFWHQLSTLQCPYRCCL